MMTKDEARKIAAGIGRQMTATAHASGAWLALLAVLATAKASCGGSALLFEAPFRFALPKSIIGTARADGARDPGEKPAC
jgi:hypothetical protein